MLSMSQAQGSRGSGAGVTGSSATVALPSASAGNSAVVASALDIHPQARSLARGHLERHPKAISDKFAYRPVDSASPVWDYFVLDAEQARAKCLRCGQELKLSSTSNLLKHLRGMHKMSDQDIWKGTRRIPTSVAKFLPARTAKSDDVHMLLARFFCENLIPLSAANAPSFRQLMDTLLRGFASGPDEQTLRQQFVPALFASARHRVFDLVRRSGDWLTLSLGSWTSPNGTWMLGIGMHLVDAEFVLHNVSLGVFESNEQHTQESVREALAKIMEEFMLPKRCIVGVVADSLPLFQHAIHAHGLVHLRCNNRLLHSCLQGALDGTSLAAVLDKVRIIASTLRIMPASLHASLVRADGVRPDGSLSWWAAAALAEALLGIAQPQALKGVERPGAGASSSSAPARRGLNVVKLEQDDVHALQSFVALWRRVHELVERLEEHSAPSSSLVGITVAAIIDALDLSDDGAPNDARVEEFVRGARTRLLDAYRRNEAADMDTHFMLCATALDPRFKDQNLLKEIAPDTALGVALKRRNELHQQERVERRVAEPIVDVEAQADVGSAPESDPRGYSLASLRSLAFEATSLSDAYDDAAVAVSSAPMLPGTAAAAAAGVGIGGSSSSSSGAGAASGDARSRVGASVAADADDAPEAHSSRKREAPDPEGDESGGPHKRARKGGPASAAAASAGAESSEPSDALQVFISKQRKEPRKPLQAVPVASSAAAAAARPVGKAAADMAARSVANMKKNAATELTTFSEEPGEHNVRLDILRWWRDRRDRLPLLSDLARRVMCIPATSSFSERTYFAKVFPSLMAKSQSRLRGQRASMQLFVALNSHSE